MNTSFRVFFALLLVSVVTPARADNSLFTLAGFEYGLEVAARRVYAPKAKAMRAWAKQYRALPIPQNIDLHEDSPGLNARLFMIFAAAPIFREIQSASFLQDVIPGYEEQLSLLNRKFKRNSIQDLDADPTTLYLAIEGIHIALEACEQNLSNSADFDFYHRLLFKVGKATAQLQGAGTVGQARAMLDTLKEPEAAAFLKRLLTLGRTQGFAMTIIQYQEWLKTKIL